MKAINTLYRVVCLLSCISSVCTGRSVTYRTKSGIDCFHCPPGTYKVEDCSLDHTDPVCRPCPSGTFQSVPNHAERCESCKLTCISPKNAEYIFHKCNATHNMECRCRDGYYRTADICLKHTKCPKGQGVVRPGTLDNNTTCQKCQPGFFSPNESLTQICQPCNKCLQGYREVTPCTAETDRECVQIEEEEDYTGGIVGGVVGGVIFLIIIGIIFFCCCCSRKNITERIKNCREMNIGDKQMNSAKAVGPGVHDYLDTSRDPDTDLLSDTNLTNLAEDLIGQEYLFFFINLFGNHQTDIKKYIEEAEMNNPKSVKLQIFFVFKKWKVLEGQNATAARIQKALMDYKPELVEKYAAFFETKDSQVHTNGHARSVDAHILEAPAEEKHRLLSTGSSNV